MMFFALVEALSFVVDLTTQDDMFSGHQPCNSRIPKPPSTLAAQKGHFCEKGSMRVQPALVKFNARPFAFSDVIGGGDSAVGGIVIYCYCSSSCDVSCFINDGAASFIVS